MAGSRLLPLALAVLLLVKPRDSSVVLVVTGVAFSVFWERGGTQSPTTSPESTTVSSISGSESTSVSSISSSESTSVSSISSSESTSVSSIPSPDPTLASTSPSLEVTPTPDSSSTEPETASLPSSGSPGSELTTISQFTNLLPQGSPTVSSPSQDADSQWIPTSHRNPGVVIAVCLLVSVLLVGSTLTAVRHCNRDAAAFQNLDTVSVGSVNQRLPFADHLQS